jgi:hypothetical protein
VSKDSDQIQAAPRKFKLGPLANLNQVTKGLAKTIRAMADGTLDSQVGARICNGLGIMRACFETQKLEQLCRKLSPWASLALPPWRQMPLRLCHRGGDANLRSAWICTRNDVLGNLAVLLAALGRVRYGHGLARRVRGVDHGELSVARGVYGDSAGSD